MNLSAQYAPVYRFDAVPYIIVASWKKNNWHNYWIPWMISLHLLTYLPNTVLCYPLSLSPTPSPCVPLPTPSPCVPLPTPSPCVPLSTPSPCVPLPTPSLRPSLHPLSLCPFPLSTLAPILDPDPCDGCLPLRHGRFTAPERSDIAPVAESVRKSISGPHLVGARCRPVKEVQLWAGSISTASCFSRHHVCLSLSFLISDTEMLTGETMTDDSGW